MDGLIGLFQGGGSGRVIVVENMVMAAKSLQGKVGLFEQGAQHRELGRLWNFKLCLWERGVMIMVMDRRTSSDRIFNQTG